MSKQADNKLSQGFRKKCPNCGNCTKFRSVKREVKPSWSTVTRIEEKHLHCSIGGFKVAKTNWCEKHTFETE